MSPHPPPLRNCARSGAATCTQTSCRRRRRHMSVGSWLRAPETEVSAANTPQLRWGLLHTPPRPQMPRAQDIAHGDESREAPRHNDTTDDLKGLSLSVLRQRPINRSARLGPFDVAARVRRIRPSHPATDASCTRMPSRSAWPPSVTSLRARIARQITSDTHAPHPARPRRNRQSTMRGGPSPSGTLVRHVCKAHPKAL